MFSGKVIKRFRDKYTRKRFEVGDEYSHEDEGRIKELQELGHLEAPEEEWPKHIGGGSYELPNGERVKGKEAAQEALKSLEESGDDA